MSHRHQVYIGSRYWREHVRPQVFARDGRRGDIHHLGYGRQWREDLDDLVTVTRVLHKRIEDGKREQKQARRRRR